MNQGYFLMRGLNKLGTEGSLTILAYNLKRLINILRVRTTVEAVPNNGLEEHSRWNMPL
jgi:hypothetical protein